MLGLSIVLAVVLVPYVVMNVRRLRRGQRWAVTYCHVLMEADLAAQAKRREARAALGETAGRAAPQRRRNVREAPAVSTVPRAS